MLNKLIPATAAAWMLPLARGAAKRGLPLYAAGGCVRDWLLGKPCRDLDLVVEGDPAPLALLCAKLLGARSEAFGRFNTLRLTGRGWRVDFAMSRAEAYPAPACLPRVRLAPIERDLARRDFTVNAMAVPLRPGEPISLIDPHGGRQDLRRRILRPLHPLSFRDDPTRVFRAARYLCRLGLKPAPGFLKQAREALGQGHAGLLSRHRLAAELLRILAEENPAPCFRLLKRWGYLKLIHPRVVWPVKTLPGAYERLGALALGLGPREGKKFLGSLPVERERASILREMLDAAERRRAPRRPLPDWAANTLLQAYSKLAPAAVRPAYLKGSDIQALGLPPGPRYRRLLEAASRRQWLGLITSRGQALNWLKTVAKRN